MVPPASEVAGAADEAPHQRLPADRQGWATGPGVIAVLASSVATEDAATTTSCILGIVSTAVTSPLSAHAVARAAHRREDRERQDRVT